MAAAGRRYDAVIVGAGHNGLVCAALLARRGLRVAVVERSERVGGAAATREIAPGFRAPLLAHTVGRFRASLAEALDLRRHGLELLRPSVRAFSPHPDGRAVTLWADPRRTAEELTGWSPKDAKGFRALDARVRRIAGVLDLLARTTPPDPKAPTIGDAVGALRLGRVARRLDGRERRELLRALPMAVSDFVADHVASDRVRAAVAVRGILHSFLGPRSAGSTLHLLTDSIADGAGAAGQTTFARGGPGALADALAAAARVTGVEIRTGAEVVRVLDHRGRVRGVALASGEELAARAVVSALDPKHTLLRLVDPVSLGPTAVWRARNLRLPGAVAKVNLALGDLPGLPAADGDAERLAGRIVIAPGIDDMERAFDDAKYGRLPSAPVVEATIPTLTDPALAPPGKHVMSVVAQYVPYHRRDGSWDRDRERLGDAVLGTLEAVAPGVSALVEARQVITPLDLERDHGLTEGHPHHGEHALDQFFAWRPALGWARYRLALDGLWLCGSGAHPGGGLTGGPGANAARELIRALGGRR